MLTVKDEILMFADTLTEEQLLELGEYMKKKAEEKKKQRGFEAYRKLMQAYDEFRKICPESSFWVETELECPDCEDSFFDDVDAFAIMDDVYQRYISENKTPF